MDSQPKQRALTLKQELFIRHYIGQAKGNGREAARLAGYEGDDHTLDSRAYDNLQHPIIKARISEFITEVCMSPEECLSYLMEIAAAPWRDFVIEIVGKDGNTVGARLDLKDKVKALELIGKHHRLFTDQVQVNGPTLKAVIGIDIDEV